MEFPTNTICILGPHHKIFGMHTFVKKMKENHFLVFGYPMKNIKKIKYN